MLLVKPKIDFSSPQYDDLSPEDKTNIQQQSDHNIDLGVQLYFQQRPDPSYFEAWGVGGGGHVNTPLPFLYTFLTNNGTSFGGPKPTTRDTINIHYRIALPNGKILDDSGIEQAHTTPPAQVDLTAPDLTASGALPAALMLLSPGDLMQLILPAISQGTRFYPQYPNAPFVWTILRMPDDGDIIDKAPAAVRAAGAEYYAKHQTSGEYMEHPMGFLYKYNQPAVEGQPRPSPTSTCSLHYEGRMITGDVFESSYKRGEPDLTSLDQLVPGVREAISTLMSVGDKITIIVPPQLAYGDQTVSPLIPDGVTPQIPGGSTLTFDLELVKF